jgi:5'-nucleotidase / UDP-sugar diphosphatase
MILYNVEGIYHFDEEGNPTMQMNPLNFTSLHTSELSRSASAGEMTAGIEKDKSQQSTDSVALRGETGKPRRTFTPEDVGKSSAPPPEAAPAGVSAPEAAPQGSSSDNTATITIISTNDLHGHFSTMPQVSGLVHQLKKENPEALVVDVGDIAYNPPYSDANHFDPMVDIMNQIGYNIVEPGNHEFQYGAPTMHDEYTSRIKADVVCSNVKDPKTNDYLPGIKPYVIKEIDGVKVAFIGTVVPDMATSAHPNVGKDVKRLDINDTVRRLLPEIKAQGAEVIVDLSHHGIGKKADVNLAQNVDGIDVILSGHDHQLTENPIVISKMPGKTYVIEGMSHGKFVMQTDIEVDKKTHEVISVTMKSYPTSTSTVKPDPVVNDIIQNYHGKGRGR